MRGCVVAAVVIGCAFGANGARADHRPVIVIPGHPEVPVIIDGVDASYHLVEGDWGLYAPGGVQPRVSPGPVMIPGPPARGYFPATGRRPRYGRQEIEPPPNRRLPPPAQSFYRSWSTEPAPPASADPPFNPPPVIMAPPAARR